MPGFVVDRYASVAVVKVDGEGAAARLADFADAIEPLLDGLGVRTLVARTSEKGKGVKLEVLHGPPPPDVVRIEEHGVPSVVDLAHGQKTGAFLDQRENRLLVGRLAKGRRILNLFSYTGGFGLHAARGGAVKVTNVDVATAAHATAQESMRIAGIDPGAHAFVTADCLAFLERARKSGQKWDLVVSDPPSFAPKEKRRGAGARGLPVASRGLRRGAGAARDTLRSVVLEPRRRDVVARHPRRRGDRARRPAGPRAARRRRGPPDSACLSRRAVPEVRRTELRV